jgi:hypothetical protein
MMRVCFAKTSVEALGGSRSATAEGAARATLAMMHTRTGGTGGAILTARDGALGLARTTAMMTWAAVTDRDEASGA